jgi:hypothetical protein
MSVPEVTQAASPIAMDEADVATGEAKPRQSWWHREAGKSGPSIDHQSGSSPEEAVDEASIEVSPVGDGDPEQAVGSGGAMAEDEQAQGPELSEVEQPFQRDLRWRRQSFLPAKWDEVRQGEREGSFWNRRSRVVPNEPEAESEPDQAAEPKSTYWTRNRTRD